MVTNSLAAAGTTTSTTTTNSATAVLAVNTAPVITGPAETETITAGASNNLSVSATVPSGTLSYQWYKGAAPLSDGGDISGSATNTLTFSSAVTGDAVDHVVVTNTVPLSGTTATTNSRNQRHGRGQH